MSDPRGVNFAGRIQEGRTSMRTSNAEDFDGKEVWYSYEEMELIRREMFQDIRKFSNILAANLVDPQDPSTFEDFFVRRIGLERLISPNNNAMEQAQAIRNAKREHVHTVLRAIERLRDIGEVLEEDPAHVSEASSREARIRAHRDAVRQLRF